MVNNISKEAEEYERKRLFALRQLNLLDTPPSESFDRITRIASQLFNLPIAAVSLTDSDRQWFKSRVGVDHWEIPRFKACCGEVADSSEVLVITDLQDSPHYRDSPLAHSGVRFYAGAPLVTNDGYTLGAMCVLGTEPRPIAEHEVALLQDLAAMVMAQIELQHAFGRIDPLTGLPNRSKFIEDIQDRARDIAGSMCFALFIDLVDINEASTLQRVMGPSYLDELCRETSRFLQELLGTNVDLYHMGICQFVLVLEGLDHEQAMSRAAQIQQELASMGNADTLPFMLRPAIGVTPFHLGVEDPATILRTAHSACQDARHAETDIGFYSIALDAKHQRRFSLIAGFRRALEHPDELHLVFQPRVSMDSGACLGVEALIRWDHPQMGPISPAEFIPLVEKTPLARAMTAWVIREAIAKAAYWHRQKLGLRVSINISAANLEEVDFTACLLSMLAEQSLPKSAIELELTESALVSNGRAARSELDALADAGIRVAIDDFGTGYSSLSYLQNVPAQVVKIDRSFIARVEAEARSQTLVNTMINMAHEFGYSVVAEGIETVEAYRLLQSLGCDEAQGYLLAKPLPAQAFEEWLRVLRRDGLTL